MIGAAKCLGALSVSLMSVMPAVVEPPFSRAAELSADSTALIVCGTGCPTPDEFWVNAMMSQFITPTHPGQIVTPVAVTTPQEAWPITGLLRVIGLVTGDPRIFGPGGAAWPDEPLWKISGFFDMLLDQSVAQGVTDLESAMAAHGDDHLVINGYSQGANLVNKEKRKLAAQYPHGTAAPDISFVLAGDPNVPNGGLASRFPGLPSVLLGTFDGAEPTNTQFHTDVIIRQYDGAADFPLYHLNVVADLNAVMGFLYLHTRGLDVSLPSDPRTSPAYQGTHGDSSYYFFPTQDLPLFAPLRQLGVPEQLIDVIEPFFRVLVEQGYDRSIPPWEPTPARLVPHPDPAKVADELVDAIHEGIDNAKAAVGRPAATRTPPPAAAAVPDLPVIETTEEGPPIVATLKSTGNEPAAGSSSEPALPTVPRSGDRASLGEADQPPQIRGRHRSDPGAKSPAQAAASSSTKESHRGAGGIN